MPGLFHGMYHNSQGYDSDLYTWSGSRTDNPPHPFRIIITTALVIATHITLAMSRFTQRMRMKKACLLITTLRVVPQIITVLVALTENLCIRLDLGYK